MKDIVVLFLITAFVFQFAGCTRVIGCEAFNESGEKEKSTTSGINQNTYVGEDKDKTLLDRIHKEKLQSKNGKSIKNEKWSYNTFSRNVPEYNHGKVITFSEDEQSCSVVISDTCEKHYHEYIDILIGSGFDIGVTEVDSIGFNIFTATNQDGKQIRLGYSMKILSIFIENA